MTSWTMHIGLAIWLLYLLTQNKQQQTTTSLLFLLLLLPLLRVVTGSCNLLLQTRSLAKNRTLAALCCSPEEPDERLLARLIWLDDEGSHWPTKRVVTWPPFTYNMFVARIFNAMFKYVIMWPNRRHGISLSLSLSHNFYINVHVLSDGFMATLDHMIVLILLLFLNSTNTQLTLIPHSLTPHACIPGTFLMTPR